MKRTIIAAALLAASAMQASAAACSPSDFEIRQLELREVVADMAGIVGEIVSHCATPAAAGLRTTLRAPDGRVVGVGHHYIGAGGFENIEPGDSAPFDEAVSIVNGFTVHDLKITGKIVDVIRW